jgi:toxin ParE1/3/4
MSRRVIFTPDARSEFDDARDDYEAARPGVGKAFQAAVRDAVRRIQRAPLTPGIVRLPDVRRVLVRGFPYILLYRLTANGIRIISVFHTSRDPAIWQQRADDE